jgi:peptide/nickel transport system permease protein
MIVRWLLALAAIAALCVAITRAMPAVERPEDGPWRRALARLRGDRSAMLGLWMIVALAALALLAPLLAPYDPIHQPDIVALKSLPPSLAHPFGTDQYSRDLLSRVLYGSRVSLAVGLLAALVAVTVGTAWGAVAGWLGGGADGVMMRLVDAMLAIPRLLLLIVVAALWGRLPIPLLVMVLGLTGWFGTSRLVRAQVLGLKERDFVLGARALGAPGGRLLVRHVLPNALSPVVVAATLGVGSAIAVEAGLSYLGLGVRPPFASWGSIIADGAEDVATLWWISLFPGLAIVTTVMAFNALGDGLRDALDPRQLPGR